MYSRKSSLILLSLTFNLIARVVSLFTILCSCSRGRTSTEFLGDIFFGLKNLCGSLLQLIECILSMISRFSLTHFNLVFLVQMQHLLSTLVLFWLNFKRINFRILINMWWCRFRIHCLIVRINRSQNSLACLLVSLFRAAAHLANFPVCAPSAQMSNWMFVEIQLSLKKKELFNFIFVEIYIYIYLSLCTIEKKPAFGFSEK